MNALPTGLARKRMAAAALLTDGGCRVLLVEPTYKDYWEIPGGAVEADESPRAAAVREVREELGLFLKVGRLLVVDWVPPRPGRSEGVIFVYDGGRLPETAAISLAPGELRSWTWSTPSEVRRRMTALLARRVEAARTALAEGATAYLEAGHRLA